MINQSSHQNGGLDRNKLQDSCNGSKGNQALGFAEL